MSELNEYKSSPVYDAHKLWKVRGKFYDFTDFLPRHPGGESFLLLGRGRDCTELFQSVHQFSQRDLVALMGKYEVKVDLVKRAEEITESKFEWNEEQAPVFTALREKVAEYLKGQDTKKANTAFYVAMFVCILICVVLHVMWLSRNNALYAILAGLSMTSLGFVGMHTASHGALAEAGWINYYISTIWNDFVFWPHFIWMEHHVYGHHSFTGMYGQDPDVRNMHPFARKHAAHRPTALTKLQGWLTHAFMLTLPNQFFGQTIQYFHALSRQKLFGMPLRLDNIRMEDVVLASTLSSLSFTFLIVVPILKFGFWSHFYTLVAYYFALGFLYWAVVFPNHDTFEVVKAAEEEGEHDWAEMQIRHSSDFYLPEWLTFLVGGMNYQIEHHLFPAVHPRHYPAISQLVRATCKEFNIPYNYLPSWIEALRSNLQFLRHFATTPYIRLLK